MKRDVFVTVGTVAYNAGGSAGVWDSNKLTVGAIALYDGSGALVASGASSITGPTTISVMNPDGIKNSVPLKDVSVSKQAYVAPVKAIKFLGADKTSGSSYTLNLPSSLSPGDIVAIGIRDRTKGFEDTSAVKTYSFTVVTGDLLTGTSAKNIIVKLAAAISADLNAVVTPTVIDDSTDAIGLKLEAKVAGNDFDIVKEDGVLKDSDIVEYHVVNRIYDASSTVAKANNPGSGTSAQVARAEYESVVRDGDTHSPVMGDMLYTARNNVVSGATYTGYTLRFIDKVDTPLTKEAAWEQIVQVFVPSGNTTLIGILDSLFAKV